MIWQNTGLDEQDVAEIRKRLTTFPNVEKAILYGSRALGTYKPGSDIDLTLAGDRLSHSDMLDIAIALDDIGLPYKIDLSLFNEIDNNALIAHVLNFGIALYPISTEN